MAFFRTPGLSIPLAHSGSKEEIDDLPIRIMVGAHFLANSMAHAAVTPFAPPVITTTSSEPRLSSSYSSSLSIKEGILQLSPSMPISTDP